MSEVDLIEAIGRMSRAPKSDNRCEDHESETALTRPPILIDRIRTRPYKLASPKSRKKR